MLLGNETWSLAFEVLRKVSTLFCGMIYHPYAALKSFRRIQRLYANAVVVVNQKWMCWNIAVRAIVDSLRSSLGSPLQIPRVYLTV